MWPKIKLYGGIVLAAIVAGLYALFRVENSKKKVAEQRAETYKDAAAENAKVIEQVKNEKKVKDDSVMRSNNDVRERLLSKARDRD